MRILRAIPALAITAFVTWGTACPYRKSNPDVLVVQTSEVRNGHDAAGRLNSTRGWRILVQR